MSKKHRFSRLGVKVALISLAALTVAYATFVLASEKFLPWVMETNWYLDYTWQSCEKGAQRFREDAMAAQPMTMEELLYDFEWKRDDPEYVYFLYTEKEGIPYNEPDDIIVAVSCTDGVVYACFFHSYEYDLALVRFLAILLGIAGLLLVMLPYVYHIVRRIGKLSRDMEILAGGDLDHQIVAKGGDELSQMGRSMEEMRRSVLEQINAEKAAVQANIDLIGSLSHDFRTPLTKLMGYLEILQYKKCSEEDRDAYLDRALGKTRQLRDMSDELFRCSQVARQPGDLPAPRTVCGPVFLQQILGEQCIDLQLRGMKITLPSMEGDWKITVRPEDILRVFDNLFSNLRKYADPEQEIVLTGAEEDREFVLTIENAVAADPIKAESRGVGLPTAEALMARNGGSLQVETIGDRYRSILRFSKAE